METKSQIQPNVSHAKNINDRFWFQAGHSNSPYQLSFISLEVGLEKLVVDHFKSHYNIIKYNTLFIYDTFS